MVSSPNSSPITRWIILILLAFVAGIALAFQTVNNARGDLTTPEGYSFKNILGFGSQNNTREVALGDLNGDGTLDLVVANYNSYSEIYFNDGQNIFTTPTSFGVSTSTESIALGDLDGDGDLDIITGNYYNYTILYFNDNAGGFYLGAVSCAAPPEGVACIGSMSDNTKSVAIGDVNEDGALDIIEGNWGYQNKIYYNNGWGEFPSQQGVGAYSATESLALGDMNGDGLLDIIEGSYQEWGAVLLNDPSHNFYAGLYDCSAPPANVRCFGIVGLDTTRSLAIGDLDGDGDYDIAAGNSKIEGHLSNTGQPNYVYWNDGLANFPTHTELTPGGLDDTWAIGIGDLNNDGHLDIAVGNYEMLNLIYFNDGAGGFDNGNGFGIPESTRTLALGDLDVDGSLDLVTGNENEQNVLYLNYPRLSFSAMPVAMEMAVVLGDVNSDGTLDIISESLFSSKALALADLNNDTFLDKIVDNLIYLNDGAGGFPVSTVYSADSIVHLTFGDLDRNGSIDLIADDGNQLQIHMNSGGVLSYASSVGVATQAEAIATGDVNQDGALDIVIANSLDLHIVYLNDGSGMFSQSLTFGGDTRATSLALADLNGDSALDAVIGVYGRQNLIYFNDGNGNFGGEVAFGDAGATTSLGIEDLNGDGALDIVVGNTPIYNNSCPCFEQGENAVYLNDGAGRLDTAIIFGGLDNAWAFHMGDDTLLALGDMDNNGTVDIVDGSEGAAFLNRLHPIGITNHPPAISIKRPTLTQNADFLSSPLSLNNQVIEVPFALFDPEGDPVGRVAAYYSMDGGGHWLPALADRPSFQGSLHFDGVDDYVLLDNPKIMGISNADFTVTAWVKVSSFNKADESILGTDEGVTDEGLHLIIRDHYPYFGFYENDTWGQTELVEGQWYHLAWRYTLSTGEQAIFVNGELDAASTGHPPFAGTGDIHLGRWLNGNYFTGQIDELQIWSVSLKESEILNLVEKQLTGDHPDLTAYYPMDEGGGIILHDASSSALDGVLGDGVIAQYPTWVGMANLSTGISEQFDPLAINQWTLISGGAATTGLCGGEFGQGLNFNGIFGGNRSATTRQINTLGGGEIRFSLRLGSLTSGCELVDIGEDIVLEYSTDGNTWYNLATYTSGSYSTFTRLTVPIPVAAQHPTTQFRWRQVAHSGIGWDNWAIDNVAIVLPRTYSWDTFSSGFFGTSQQVVFRLVAAQNSNPEVNYSFNTYTHHGCASPSVQWPSASATTYPFTVGGTQVYVRYNSNPAQHAIVYRLPAGEITGAAPLGGFDTPFETDEFGFLEGRAELWPGDQIAALLPIASTETYTLYFTSALPTASGLNLYTVSNPGVQVLTVSSARPLLLFNLDVSLQWDARYDTTYLAELEYNLQRASELFFDWSDGQAALGQVRIFQNREHWNDAHIRIYASNRLRPMAQQGGITTEVISDTQITSIAYAPGQVHMGPVWSRYGDAGADLGDDWPRALAHELGHFAFFLNDNYLGLDSEGNISPLDSCPGAMADPYRLDAPYDEFHPDLDWLPACESSLSHQTTGRSDWATILQFYPELFGPADNIGPSRLPLAVTQVSWIEPSTPSQAFADPTFYLEYSGSRYTPSSSARAFLFQSSWAIDLGNPRLDRVLARGAKTGDRLCIYDLNEGKLGCAYLTSTTNAVQLFSDSSWQPNITVTPVSSTTLQVEVTNLPTGLDLRAALYPFTGPRLQTKTFTDYSTYYQTTFSLTEPLYEGYIHIFVNETAPRREAIADFAVGGNPAYQRGIGAYQRGMGAYQRGIGAPVASTDGQAILFIDDSLLAADEFYTLQASASLPLSLPWATPVGTAYRLSASSTAPPLAGSSLLISYLSSEVPPGEEAWLRIYYLPDSATSWQILPTTLDLVDNAASTIIPGPGTFALMSAIEIPLSGPAWNNFPYTILGTHSITETLTSINGAYNTLCRYFPDDSSDPWSCFGVGVPEYAIDLYNMTYGSYWIYATQPITLYLKGGFSSSLVEEAFEIGSIESLQPPAIFYGQALHTGPGVSINATISGRTCGQATTFAAQDQVVYVLKLPADCAVPGASITFRIADLPAQPSALWSNDRFWHLDLDWTILNIFFPVIIH